MAYLHYTRTPITSFIDGVKQYKESFKPRGLWLSEGEDWLEWCDREGFSTCNMETCYIYAANIKKDTLITISTIDELEAFQAKYESTYGIDWAKVACDYDGICFEKYYDLKREYMMRSQSVKGIWILGIDVNSVCLWNPSKVMRLWMEVRKGQEVFSYYHPTETLAKEIYKTVHGSVQ